MLIKAQRKNNFRKITFALLLGTFFLNLNSVFAQVENKFGTPNALTGKTGVAGPASVDSATYNPAQASLLKQTEVAVGWGPIYTEYMYRYPGFAAQSSKKLGPDGFPIPRFVYKYQPRIGFGGIIIPFPVNQDIKVKNLPMVIFNQLNFVDIKGKGTLNGFADLFWSYILSPAMSVGVNLKYISFTGKGDLRAAGIGGNPIASFEVSAATTSVGLGTKIRVSDMLTLGVASSVFSSTTQKSSFETNINLGSDEETDNGKAKSTTSSTFLNPLRFGLGLKLSPKTQVMFDLEYVQAPEQGEVFSVVNLTYKKKDVSDTLSPYFGLEFKWSPVTEFLFGGFYEPSSVGPGSPDKNGKAGFGFMDLAMNLGDPPSEPQWMIGGGVRKHFMPVVVSSPKGKKRQKYQLGIEYGITYGETSIGIDDGEQPGAYYVRRIKLPLTVIYSF